MKKIAKSLKSLLALLLTLTMVCSLAACTTGGETTYPTDNVTQPSNQETNPNGEMQWETDFSDDEEITITVMTMDYVYAPTNSDLLVWAELARRTKVNIEFQVVSASDYASKLNTAIMTNTLPDMINVVDIGNIIPYVEDGIVKRLNEYMETLAPSLMKQIQAVDPELKQLKDDNGNMWFLPKIDTSELNTMYMINQDMLDQVNMKAPTTMDEFYEVLKAFKGLGSDVIPLGVGFATSLETPIFNGFRTSYGTRWFYNDDEYVYTPYQHQDRIKSALQFMNKLYSEGLIDQEYYVRSGDDALSILSTGKVGVFNCWHDEMHQWMAETSDYNYVPLYPMSSEYGQGIMGRRNPFLYYFCLSANTPHADRIIRMLNYMCTEEGMELMNWGIEGETFYRDENGDRHYVDEIVNYENNGAVEGRRQYGMDLVNMINFMDYDSWKATVSESLPPVMENLKGYYFPDQPNLVLTPDEADECAQIMTDVEKHVSTSYLQFIVGLLNFDEDWDNFIAKMEQLGIEDAIEIRHNAFERWLER